jgi:hypothetical protein
MSTLLTIAIRNLARYRRRSLLTASLIAIGVVAVVLFGAAADAFKGLMVGQITDAMLGHLQIHRRGYVASLDNLPLTLMLSPADVTAVEEALRAQRDVDTYSRRLKCGGLFSNYTETTAIRLNGIYPEEELRTIPLLASRVMHGTATLRRGEILIPELLAEGMEVELGDTVVVIATQRRATGSGHQPAIGRRRRVQQRRHPPLDYSTEYDVASVDQSGEDYLLELKAKTRGVAYDRLRMWVTRTETLPTRIECLTATSMLIKTLHFKDVTDFGAGIVRPATIETDSPLYKGYTSSMVFVQMTARAFPPEVFTLTYMPNLEAIRR